MTDYQELFARVMMKSAPAPLAVLARGEGARVWDIEGTEYLDFLAGIAVNSLGHAHPAFVDAVSRQAATLAHVSNYFATEPQLELADRLTRLTGGDRVFLCNSGAEAIEVNGVRVVANTYFSGDGGELSVDGRRIRAPYEFEVIGKPQDLEPALNIPGGVVQTLEKEQATAEVTRSEDIVIDALRPAKQPDYARSSSP